MQDRCAMFCALFPFHFMKTACKNTFDKLFSVKIVINAVELISNKLIEFPCIYIFNEGHELNSC